MRKDVARRQVHEFSYSERLQKSSFYRRWMTNMSCDYESQVDFSLTIANKKNSKTNFIISKDKSQSSHSLMCFMTSFVVKKGKKPISQEQGSL